MILPPSRSMLLAGWFAVSNLLAQNGDRPGETQAERIPADKIPPAPVLPPEEALKSFKVPEGFKVEIVAAEPLVEAPVLMQFDPDGRLWVLEMRGYMPNPEGKGEDAKTGRVSILEDTDQDGRMDKRTTFQDNLVLPRALVLTRGGALVGEPPKLWFLRDTDGDLKADDFIEVATDYGGRENPEHTSNGLIVGLDNWIYSANHTTRYRFQDAEWKKEPTVFRGQWGISQDDFGRLFFNSNSDHLRADLVPSHYFYRNSHLRGVTGLNFAVAKDQSVWPGRMNPGVNRGYQPQQLRADGTLATFTGACAPLIYRGDQFPESHQGNAFVCEPTGNFVRRSLLKEQAGIITAENAHARTEFLTSTDERFRPVSLANGPDGALYVVDMYRGIIQHRIYLTSYLRKQALSRGLEKGLEHGRIYRVVRTSAPPTPKTRPGLGSATPAQLAEYLSHPNGWHRDTAQRLLVESSESSAAAPLRQIARSHANPKARLHALWTLEGLALLDRPTLMAALGDSHERVAAAAIRLSEPFLARDEMDLFPKLIGFSTDPRHAVRLQLAFSLARYPREDVDTALVKMIVHAPTDTLLREAVVSGWVGREAHFLEAILSMPTDQKSSLLPTLGLLARCVWNEGQGAKVSRILQRIAASGTDSSPSLAVLQGLNAAAPKPNTKNAAPPRPVKLDREPSELVSLKASPNSELAKTAESLLSVLVWSGKPGYVEPKVIPLNAEDQALFDEGKPLYQAICGACHQPTGLGQDGLAPPVLDSEWVLGSPDRLIRIVLHGVRGKLTVKGVSYNLEMPPLSILDDRQVAAILTYMRREWGHNASPISPATIQTIRQQTESRAEAWTEPELLKLP